MSAQGMLDVKQLEELSDSGEIDTVLCMFTDLQGRFQGKRVLPTSSSTTCSAKRGSTPACTCWRTTGDGAAARLRVRELGDGLRRLQDDPDLKTLRLCPWLEKTAIVICDIHDEDTNEPVEVAPRQILKRQIQRGGGAGFVVKTGSELEFYLFKDSYEEAADAVPGPAAALHLHHGLPHAPDHQGRMDHPADPQRHGRPRASRSSSRRASSARGSTRSTSRTATRCRTPTTTRSTSTASRRSVR